MCSYLTYRYSWAEIRTDELFNAQFLHHAYWITDSRERMAFVRMELAGTNVNIHMHGSLAQRRTRQVVINERLTLPSIATTGTLLLPSPAKPNASKLLCPCTAYNTTVVNDQQSVLSFRTPTLRPLSLTDTPDTLQSETQPTCALSKSFQILIWHQYYISKALCQRAQSRSTDDADTGTG